MNKHVKKFIRSDGESLIEVYAKQPDTQIVGPFSKKGITKKYNDMQSRKEGNIQMILGLPRKFTHSQKYIS